MSKEKTETQAKESIEARVTTLEKQCTSTAYVVRRIKDWLETIYHADIDGGGQVEKAKRSSDAGRVALVMAIGFSCVVMAFAGKKDLFNVNRTGANYPFSVGSNNITYAENMIISNNLTVSSGAITSQTLRVTDTATIDTNLNVSGAITTDVLTVTSGSAFPAGDIERSELATTGDGTVVAAVASVVESVAEIKSTVITFTNTVLTTTAGSAEGENVKVYDFDDGAISLISAVMNGVVVSSGGITGTVLYVACGTVAANDDADLTGTEADIIPRTTIDQSAAGVTTNDFDAILATVIIFDGTGTASDIYVNLAIDQDGQEFDATNTFTGTLTLYYTKPVDN